MTKKGKRLLKIKLKTFKWDKTITPPLDVLIGVNLDLFSIQLIDNYGQERTGKNYKKIQQILIQGKKEQ